MIATRVLCAVCVAATMHGVSPVVVHAQAANDSAAVVAAVSQFHAALARGDSLAALALLADDAIILEAGGVETRAAYRGHHLPADIEFARAVPSDRTVRQVTVVGDAAWVVSTSTSQGTFRDRAIDSDGAELVILRKTQAGWLIASIHWSSRTRRRN